MSLWGELKRRNVFKVAVAYLIASWLIVQVVGVLTEPLSLPDALDTVVIVLLAIAVLPCDDLSPDPSDSFFAVGIHEELLNRLASLSGLDVVSRTSVQQYASQRPPIQQIAAELSVDAIIECSARYAGNRVLLTTQLIDGTSDRSLWSQAYPADMSDLQSLFEIQAEIAMNIANALQVEFFPAERERIERAPTESREAYELFLQARDIEKGGPARRAEVLALVNQALSIDPSFTSALAFRARLQATQLRTTTTGTEVDPGRRAELRRETLDDAALALSLDDSLVDAWVARALIAMYSWRWREAEDIFLIRRTVLKSCVNMQI